MKNYKKTPREDYTLFQEIIDTYRYPDGTLNKVAVFISTLALVLLITLGHFVIVGIKNIRGMNTVSASELTVDEIEKYITNTYLDAIDDYTPGELDQEAAKRKILKFLAEYVQSSNGFTTEQNEALLQIMEEYLTNNDIYSNIEDNRKAIEELTKVIDNKYAENKSYVDQLIALLQSELDENTNADDERYKELTKELENLKSYSDGRLDEASANLNSLIDGLKRTYENSLGATEYAGGKTYQKGDYVIYQEHLYVSLKDNNTASPTDSNAWELTDLEKIIANLQKTVFQEMESMYNELKTSQEESEAMLTETINQQGEDFQAQIDRINERISSNEQFFQFGFNPDTGTYGFMVNGEFKPW